jgi:hypothetical protein
VSGHNIQVAGVCGETFQTGGHDQRGGIVAEQSLDLLSRGSIILGDPSERGLGVNHELASQVDRRYGEPGNREVQNDRPLGINHLPRAVALDVDFVFQRPHQRAIANRLKLALYLAPERTNIDGLEPVVRRCHSLGDLQ